MSKAVKDYDAGGTGPLSRVKGKPDTTYSPIGIWGDATLATREKGRVVVEAWVAGLLGEIEETRVAAVPAARHARDRARVPDMAPRAPGATLAPPAATSGSPGDERDIRRLTLDFQAAWNILDSWGVASLWTPNGYLQHADGVVERGRQSILEARATMFARREYRFSRHRLTIGPINFISRDVATASGTWELMGVMDENRKVLRGLALTR